MGSNDILSNIFLKNAESIYNDWLSVFLMEHPLNTEEQFREVLKTKISSWIARCADDISFEFKDDQFISEIDLEPTRQDFIADKLNVEVNLSGIRHTLLALEKYMTLNPLGAIDSKLEFVDYIRTNDNAVIERILRFVNGAKGLALAKILYAIHKADLIPHPTSLNHEQVFEALTRIGAAGTRQAMNTQISQINRNYPKYEDDIKRIASQI